MEELVLTDPVVVPGTTTTKYKVRRLLLDYEAIVQAAAGPGLVQIDLRDDIGGALSHSYIGQPAIDMLKWMNTANFSVNSMHKRILQKLSNDGVIPGTVTGTPEPPPPEL